MGVGSKSAVGRVQEVGRREHVSWWRTAIVQVEVVAEISMREEERVREAAKDKPALGRKLAKLFMGLAHVRPAVSPAAA